MAEGKFGVGEAKGNSITIAVAEKIAKINPRVEEQVVDTLVDRELDKRSKALVIVLDKLAELEKGLKKLGPDQVNYNPDGSKATEFFSKSRLDEKNKHIGKIDKHTKAITKALDNGDFSDVYNLSQGKDTGDGKDSSGKNKGEGGGEAEQGTDS